MNHRLVVLLSGLMPVVVAAAQAVPCALVMKGATVVESPQGQTLPLPDPEHPNCAGLSVQKGLVVACVSAPHGGGHCRSFRAKSVLDADSLKHAAAAPGPWDTLVAMVKGDSGRAFAISRSDEALPPLPTGAAVLVQPSVQLDFSAHPALRGAQSLELREGGSDGRLVATLTPAAPGLDTALLQPGQAYWWRVRSDQPGLPVLGRFTLADADLRAAGRAERTRIARAAAGDAEAQAVLWAGWLHAQRARHEAAEVLQAAGIGMP